jgi:hypothetical protein
MKRIMGLFCLALFCLGVAWVEYEMVLHFGSMLILFAVSPLFGVLLVALLRAPEGYERPDGFHVRARCRRRSSLIRRIRLIQPARARGWR